MPSSDLHSPHHTQNTHKLKIHKVRVRVRGWHEVTPLSVDKVGVYFREAQPVRDVMSTIVSPSPNACNGVIIM